MSLAQRMQLYCLTDPDYYDVPGRLNDSATRFAWDRAPVPDGWRRKRQGLWSGLYPEGRPLPGQGWKIHVSAVPDQATSTLDAVVAVCLEQRVAVKFQRSLDALRFVNGKYMGRESAGKFITVYPASDREFGELVEVLSATLDGRPGPYILSDLRIGTGPVHVRYGAFTEQWCPGPDGLPVPALRDASGTLVPDDRRPVFRIPDWIRPPAFLGPHLAARNSMSLRDLPYRVIKPLYFTSGGGTYLAEHRKTGQQVVLREARPDAGLDGLGVDATTRLHREYEVLRRLDGLDCVPRAYGLHAAGGHEYLAEEHIEGLPLFESIIFRTPMRFIRPAPGQLRDYLDWAGMIIDGLAGALDAIHARGIAFRDLHPANVIVRPDGSVALIDFEYAGDLEDPSPPRVGAAGFMPPAGLAGAAADQYALRAVWLMMLLPMAEITALDPAKRASLEALARQLFGLPADAGPPLAAPARPAVSASGEDTMAALFNGETVDWPGIRQRLIAGIRRAATPDRDDRLFPADPEVFQGQGTSIAHGAAGVLLALRHAGAGDTEEYADWLAAAVRRDRPRPGLLGGLHGAALVLAEAGHEEVALEALVRCDAVEPPGTPDLFGGLAGIALAQCQFARLTGDDSLLDRAVRAGLLLDTLVREGSAGSLRLPPSAGLLHGMGGTALLHLRLYRMTGEDRFLDAARRALTHDIGHCVRTADGAVQVKAGNRHFLYIDRGSGGLALAAADYLEARHDPGLAEFVRQVMPGCGPLSVREPGLFHGRSGLLSVLTRGAGQRFAGASPAVPADAVLTQVRRLSWQAVVRDDALLIPGHYLQRFSADLATGAAGVLLALHSVFDGRGDLLSLLPGFRDRAPSAVA